jgi:hypothetical protein
VVQHDAQLAGLVQLDDLACHHGRQHRQLAGNEIAEGRAAARPSSTPQAWMQSTK